MTFKKHTDMIYVMDEYHMLFEFDPEKSRKNHEKHGITFDEAQALFANDPLRLPPLTVQGEERSLVIGRIGASYWTAIITVRKGAIRIITCRRSRDNERALYDQKA